MKVTKAVVFPLALTAFVLGCRTPHNRDYGLWLFIPTPSLDTVTGYPAEVSLPARHYTTNRIKVFVGGEVVSPGTVSVPLGSTVLQAVGYAGGFTPFAFGPCVRLIEDTGEGYRLRLRSAHGQKLVWYTPEDGSRNTVTPRSSHASSQTDYVLKDGDRLYALRVYVE